MKKYIVCHPKTGAQSEYLAYFWKGKPIFKNQVRTAKRYAKEEAEIITEHFNRTIKTEHNFLAFQSPTSEEKSNG